MASQAENITILEQDYYLPIQFIATDTKLVTVEAQPCNKEITYKLEPAPKDFSSEINALVKAQEMGINNRFEAGGIINLIQNTRAEAVDKVTKELENISNKCGPIAIETMNYTIGIDTWPPPQP